MSESKKLLPAGFEALEPFVAVWAIESAAGRARRRLESSATELAAFYDAAKALVPAGLEYLDRKPPNQFDEKEQRLMNVLLSFCHVVQAVEIHGDHEPLRAQGLQRMKITRASADLR